MEVQHSNGDNIESHETTDISQELEVAKAVIGFAFLAVVGLVTTPAGQIIPPRTSLWFLALVNSVAFSASLLWIWHSCDFPQFAKAMKVIGVRSIVITFFMFLDLKFSSYRWAIWLSCAVLLLCLAPYDMMSNIYQFIIKKIRRYIGDLKGGPQGQGAARVEFSDIPQGQGAARVEFNNIPQGQGAARVEFNDIPQGQGAARVEFSDIPQGQGQGATRVEFIDIPV